MALTPEQERVRSYLLSQSEGQPWLDLWPRVARARLDLVEALGDVNDVQARFRPAEGEWTILEAAHHLLENSRAVIAAVKSLADGRRVPGQGPLVDDLTDPGEQRIADLRRGLIATGIELGALAASLPEPPPLDVTHPHAFFGELHCKAWYLFQRVHDLDHGRQIAQVKAAEGYPAP